MDPAAKGQRLLYISDEKNRAVYVYGASNKLVGTLTGFLQPLGECVDAVSDVWIVDGDGNTVVEYAHGGTTPISGISTSAGDAVSCSVDPTTGDIAIGVYSFTSAPGWIQVCTLPSRQCTILKHSPVSYVSFVSYDKNGNLYADGLDRNREFVVFAVRAPGGNFQKITIKGATINTPGALVNKFGVLSLGQGGSGTSTIYQIAPDGTVTGSTQLSGADFCVQFAISGNLKYARATCANSGGNVTKYKYPAGGNPVVTLSGPFSEPFAAVYSNP